MTTWLLILIVGRGAVGMAITALPWPYESKTDCYLAGREFVGDKDETRSFACVPAPQGQ